MKAIKITLAALMAMCLCTLAACSNGGGSDATGEEAFVGNWNWEINLADLGLEDIAAGMSEEEVEALLAQYGTVTLTIAEDKSFTLDVYGAVTEGTWELKDKSTVTLTVEGEPQDAVLKDGKLTMEAQGVAMTFVKE